MRDPLPIAMLVVASACAARQPASKAATAAESEPAGRSAATASADSRPGVASQPVRAASPSNGAPADSGDVQRGRSLPEVGVEAVGLHIGGGPNDEAHREPFKRAIGAHDAAFLRCYRLVEDPMRGGTFGVDLFIPRRGGKPEVRQPRTGMRGAAFRRCVLEAFADIQFEPPVLGPTVISYSLKFTVSDSGN